MPSDQITEVANRLPNGEPILIPSSGHGAYFEQADAWNYTVERFLDKHH